MGLAPAQSCAFERTNAFTSSHDWVTHPTNFAGGGCHCVGGGEGLESARKSMIAGGRICRRRSALCDGWTLRAPLGSSLPKHDDRYMQQANASEVEAVEPQQQAMGNDSVEFARWGNSESDVTRGVFPNASEIPRAMSPMGFYCKICTFQNVTHAIFPQALEIPRVMSPMKFP